MIQNFLALAERGENVFLSDVFHAFQHEKARICCELER